MSFGFLIRQLARDLSRDLPNLRTSVTLSPAPGFAAWLEREGTNDTAADSIAAPLREGRWRDDEATRARLASAHRVDSPANSGPGVLKRPHGLVIS